LEQNAAYISNWINALKNDFSLIAVAASKAEKAVEYILGGKA
jgi:antirestriction protein ArdC